MEERREMEKTEATIERKESLANQSGFPYIIDFTEQGVYLELADALLDAPPVLPALVAYDIKRRGISSVNSGEMVLRLRQKHSRFRLADPQEEKQVDAAVYVTIERGAMEAELTILPPTKDGAALAAQDILRMIRESWGVTHGIDEALVTEMAEEAEVLLEYYKTKTIAHGTPPERGADATVTLLFGTERDFKPTMLDDGSVDYKKLNIFTSVKEGEPVVVRVPPQMGTPGRNVQGVEIPALLGNDRKMLKGKNVRFSEDGNTMFAEKEGRIDFVRDMVVVSDVLQIPGDVDMSVGNIDFTGDVRIGGGVIAGLTVKAGGNIEVNETVECATLIAGRDIILKKGIQGMDKGVLKAGGNIISRFIERCNVEAGESVHSDYIVYSKVEAAKSVVLRGKRGRLIGGTTCAGSEVIARTIGTPTGEKTILELSAAPELRGELNELITTVASTKAQLDKIDSLTRMYKHKGESDERMEMWTKLQAGREQLKLTYEKQQNEVEELRERIRKMPKGKVHIYGEAYHDVKVTIDFVTYTFKETVVFTTMKYKDGAIVFTACETGER